MREGEREREGRERGRPGEREGESEGGQERERERGRAGGREREGGRGRTGEREREGERVCPLSSRDGNCFRREKREGIRAQILFRSLQSPAKSLSLYPSSSSLKSPFL